jgi:hypothetical protein
MKISRRRILAIGFSVLLWLIGVLLEDSVKRVFSKLFSFNIYSLKMNPYVFILTIGFIILMIGLVVYWEISDKNKLKRKYMAYLISELRKSQIANRYNLEVIKSINMILKQKLGEEGMLHGFFHPEVSEKLKAFKFDSLDLINDDSFEDALNTLADGRIIHTK